VEGGRVVRLPRIQRFDSASTEASIPRTLSHVCEFLFRVAMLQFQSVASNSHNPLAALVCCLVPDTLIRRPGKDGDPGRSYASASRHAVVVSGSETRFTLCYAPQLGEGFRLNHNRLSQRHSRLQGIEPCHRTPSEESNLHPVVTCLSKCQALSPCPCNHQQRR